MELLVALMEEVLEPDSDCLDVGAHAGSVLAELVRLAPEGRHVAWEPLPEFAERLRRAYPEVEVREAALSDEAGRHESRPALPPPPTHERCGAQRHSRARHREGPPGEGGNDENRPGSERGQHRGLAGARRPGRRPQRGDGEEHGRNVRARRPATRRAPGMFRAP